MPNASKQIIIPQSGTRDIRYNITGSGEQYYSLKRPLSSEESEFTKQQFKHALKKVSRPLSQSGTKKK